MKLKPPPVFLVEPLENRVLLTSAGYSPANIIAYFPDYRFSVWPSVSLNGLSEINYFSITPNDDGSLPSLSTGGKSFSQLQTIVAGAHAATPRVAVSIVVDWHTDYDTILASSTATTNLINNLMAFSATYSLDGIDLDYEPDTLTTDQKNIWGGFLTALHRQTSAHSLILSEAVQASQMVVLPAYFADLDRFNLMDYVLDYNSTAPYNESITYLTNWTNYGVPRSKLIMGVPFYGSAGTSWATRTTQTYSQLLTAYAAANGGAYPAANLDSITLNGTAWGYNGITTLQNKAQYVLQNGYGGIMIWELGQDHFVNNKYDSYSLLPAIKSVFAGVASTVVNAGALMINTATGGGTTTLSEAAGTFTIASPGGTYTAGSAAVSSILITGSGGADTLNITTTLDKPLSFVGEGAGRDALNVSGGTVNLQAPAAGAGIWPQTLGMLSIGSSATVILSGASSHADRTVLMLNSLTVAGSSNAWTGQLDLQWNDLLIHNGVLSNVSNQIASGFNATGATRWSGKGIASSNASISNLNAVGVATGLTTFDGLTVTATDLLVKFTYFGDANLDGKVDGSDYTLIDSSYTIHLGTGWFNGNFNYDNVINGSDYTLIDNAFNTQGASLAAEIPPVAKASSFVFALSQNTTTASLLFSAEQDELKKHRQFSNRKLLND